LGYSLPPQSGGDDNTITELTYVIDRDSPIRLDVVDDRNPLIKTIVNGNAGNAACCTTGEHVFTWDQKDTSGQVVPDGKYAFVITPGTSPIDTEVFSTKPDFHSQTDPFPNPVASTATDANNNRFFVNTSTPSLIGKNNSNGLYITNPVEMAQGQAAQISVDAYGNLYVRSSTGAISAWQAGRLPFEDSSISAIVGVPWNRAMVKATVPIIGGATARNFRDFTVDTSPGWPWRENLVGESTALTGENGILPGGFFADNAELDFSHSTWTVLNHSLSEVRNNFEFLGGQNTVYGNLATWETGLEPGEEYS
jgi:hypothetical protein